jgi:hypothetical protein
MEPTNQHVTIGAFDDARTMIVPVFQWKNQFALRLCLAPSRRDWQHHHSQEKK